MSIEFPQTLTPSEPLAARIETDRRRHRRVALSLLGRFMRANKQEYPCKLVDISVGGAAFVSPVGVADGERVVIYLDIIGGLEGKVVRQLPGGFAVEIIASQHKREKLAAQLTWLANRHEFEEADGRRHERIVPKRDEPSLQFEDGVTLPCKVLDVSISGALVKTEARPGLGSEVMLGKLRSRVVRHDKQGIALQFLDIQQPTALRRYFG